MNMTEYEEKIKQLEKENELLLNTIRINRKTLNRLIEHYILSPTVSSAKPKQ